MTQVELAEAKAAQAEAAARAERAAAVKARDEANRLLAEAAFAAKRLASEELKAASGLRVVSNYSFYADDGVLKSWPQGAVVTDQNEIALLIGRGAHVVRIELSAAETVARAELAAAEAAAAKARAAVAAAKAKLAASGGPTK